MKTDERASAHRNPLTRTVMEREAIQADELRYNKFSIVFIQVFSVDRFDVSRLCTGGFSKIDNTIDGQIFITDELHESPVERYGVRGFDFSLSLDEPYPVTLSGHIFVEVSVFFNRTVSVTYRMVVDGDYCKCSGAISTDHLISLASLNMGAEHWSCDDDKKFSTINLDIADMRIENLYIDEHGRWLDKPVVLPETEVCGKGPYPEPTDIRIRDLYLEKEEKEQEKPEEQTARPENKKVDNFAEILRRYKLLIGRDQIFSETKDMNYVYVDVWEDVSHTGHLFASMKEPEIIDHIYRSHVKELVGLMSLYPYEWPYRTDESFDDVCGSNVAIDTDDLILVNPNICVVFGTYGLRGQDSPTDWEKHLRERKRYHVSWPEYLLILEMVLAKKYTITVALDLFLYNTLAVSSLRNARNVLEDNARRSLRVTKLLLQLDAVKYSRYVSHKIMFERTTRRLEVDRDVARLNDAMDKIDQSLFNISEMRKLKQSGMLNVVLGCISAASLFGILFQQVEVPFMQRLGLHEFSGHVGLGIVTFTLALIVFGSVMLIVFSLRNNKL